MSDSSSPRSVITWPVIAVATLVALIAAGAVLYLAGSSDESSDAGSLALTPTDEVVSGDPLDLAFIADDGTTGTVRDLLDGRPLVVNFFASWCPPCIGEMPDFETVHRELGDDVRFVGIAVQDRPEDARRIVDETGITYEWRRDVRGDIANGIGVVNMPTTILLHPDGTRADNISGAVDADGLRSEIADAFGIES